MTDPASPSSSRIDSLDGLRAISIAIVVLGHASYGAGRFEPLLAWMPTGIGVDVFFVVSGYLITRLLLAEHDKTGAISLPEFYIRRVVRIFPALYVYVGVIALLAAAGFFSIAVSGFVGALTFTWNYPIGDRAAWWLGHCWSLSVEEQFYFFWPCLLGLLGARRALRAAIGIVLAEPVVRVLQYAAFPSTRGYIPIMGHTRIDIVLFGCLLALFERDAKGREWLRKHVDGRVALGALALMVVVRVLEIRLRGAWQLPIGWTLEGASIATIVFWSVTHPASAFGRFLNARPVAWLGKISYSLYLWQQLFLTHPGLWAPPIAFPLDVAAALGAASASYYFVEKPLLRRRDRVVAWWRALPRQAQERSTPGE